MLIATFSLTLLGAGHLLLLRLPLSLFLILSRLIDAQLLHQLLHPRPLTCLRLLLFRRCICLTCLCLRLHGLRKWTDAVLGEECGEKFEHLLPRVRLAV
jgi:hypothetical protein